MNTDTEIATIPALSYAELGRALLWDVEESKYEDFGGITVEGVTLSHRKSPTRIEIDPLVASRYERDELVERADHSEINTIVLWIGAGFHLTLSQAALESAREQVSAEFAEAK